MLHQYPFHGRLLIFLIPSVHLLVAEGAAALARPGGPKLTFALAAFLLAQPVLDVLWYRLIQKRHHAEYDSHGDLHPDLLDYLENVEKIKALDERMRRARANRVDTDPRPVVDGQPPAARAMTASVVSRDCAGRAKAKGRRLAEPRAGGLGLRGDRLVAAALRLYQLGRLSFWYDEVVTMRLARSPSPRALFERLFEIDATRAPLHPLLLEFWLQLFGTSEFAARSFSVLCGVATIILIYQIGFDSLRQANGPLGRLAGGAEPDPHRLFA